MSNATPPPSPGFRNQAGTRTVLRVLGVVTVLVALALLVTAGMEFFPLLAVGGWLLQAGFMGAGARYASGEGGPYCRSFGARNDAEARFCDSCGTAMV